MGRNQMTVPQSRAIASVAHNELVSLARPGSSDDMITIEPSGTCNFKAFGRSLPDGWECATAYATMDGEVRVCAFKE